MIWIHAILWLALVTWTSQHQSRFVDVDSLAARQKEEARVKLFGRPWTRWLGDILGVSLTFGTLAVLALWVILGLVFLGFLK